MICFLKTFVMYKKRRKTGNIIHELSITSNVFTKIANVFKKISEYNFSSIEKTANHNHIDIVTDSQLIYYLLLVKILYKAHTSNDNFLRVKAKGGIVKYRNQALLKNYYFKVIRLNKYILQTSDVNSKICLVLFVLGLLLL